MKQVLTYTFKRKSRNCLEWLYKVVESQSYYDMEESMLLDEDTEWLYTDEQERPFVAIKEE